MYENGNQDLRAEYTEEFGLDTSATFEEMFESAVEKYPSVESWKDIAFEMQCSDLAKTLKLGVILAIITTVT